MQGLLLRGGIMSDYNFKEETRSEKVNGRVKRYKWYSIQVYLGKDADGKKKYQRFSGRDKNELLRQIAQAESDLKETKEKAETITLGEAMTRYIENRRAISSPATIKGYLVVRNQYLPELMELPIDKLNQDVIQCEMNEFAKSHSPKTCRNAHGLISAVLKVNRPELILHTSLPPLTKKDIYVPDEAEVSHIMELISGNELQLSFLLATQCGLRESEIAALSVKNIEKDYLYVREARVAGVDGQAYKSPKSQSGYRKVPISADVYNYLIEEAEKHEGHVTAMTGQQISKAWTTFRDKQGIDKALNFHALRHHFASKCLLMGLPQKYIAELMGHSSTDMIERVYQHTFPSAMEGFAKELREKMLAPNMQIPRGTDNPSVKPDNK